MQFIYPSFLWALLLIAVPIIIHLVNLRRHQTVYFSNVNFLKKVKKESQRRSKLKQFLILMCRIMLITMLVVSFAKPYIPTGNSEKQKANSVSCIYIDNSYSMSAEGPEGVAIESAKQKAYSIVNASQPDTKFALLTNELSEKHYRFFNKQEITQLIGEVDESYNQVLLSTVFLRFNNMMGSFLNETDKRVYIISDFQKNTNDLGNLKQDTLITYNFVPVFVNQVSNIFIDSCWFEAPAHYLNQIETIEVSIVNRSDEEYYGIPVNLYINDSLKALATIDIAAKEKKSITLKYTNLNQGLQQGRIEISDYPIVYDNTIYFSYDVNNLIHALLVKPGSTNVNTQNIEALFSGDEFVQMDVMRDDRLQISQLSNYSAIFLYELMNISSGLASELKKYVENGGVLTIIPAFPCNVENYNSLLSSLLSSELESVDTVKIPIGEVLYDHLLYRGVFKQGEEKVVLPAIKNRYRFSDLQNVVETNLLSFADKSKALSVSTFGKGKTYTFSFPFSKGGNAFVNHILFLPTIYNLVLFSSSDQQLYYVMGKDRFISLKNPFDKVLQSPVLKKHSSESEFKPSVVNQEGSRLQISLDPEIDAGLYKISMGNDVIGGVAVNFDLNESDLTCYSHEELKILVSQAGIKYFNMLNEKNGNFEGAVYELDHGSQYWKLFIFIGLFFLLIELAIIKFWDKIF
jgi:hypothetical protein